MVEQNSTTDNWMNDITPKTATLKVLDGEESTFTFKDNGVKKDSVDYGKSVAFQVKVSEMIKIIEGNKFPITPKDEESLKTFYVKSNNFDLLAQIKELAKNNNGNLIGLKAKLSRKGKLRSDTRYTIRIAD